MKKLIEDTETKRIQATCYSTTLGLKVGDPHFGIGFQDKVINIASKVKV